MHYYSPRVEGNMQQKFMIPQRDMVDVRQNAEILADEELRAV